MAHAQLTHLILLVSWGLFCLVWLGGAAYNSWKAPAIEKRENFIPAWLIGFIVVLLVGLFIPGKLWAFMIFNALWLWIAGLVFLLLSLAFTFWARWKLGTMWSTAPEIKAGHELRTTGPYRLTRHPIYTGILGMLFGSMLLSGFGAWALYFLGSWLIIELKIASEERLLKESFGEAYTKYQQHTPQVIPGLQLFKKRSQ